MDKPDKIDRGIKNIVFGIVNQVLTIVAGLFLPRLILLRFGSDTNGILSNLNQIFVYFSLLEAGVGTAALQALYKPVAERDRNKINGIMSATSRYYNRTGIFYLLAVIAFSVIFPLVVKSDIPFLELFTIILLQGLVGVYTYFLQGKYRYLLEAEGKNYIVTNLTSIVTILTNVSKIALLLLGADLILVQATYLVFSFVQITYILIYIKKHYPWVNTNETPDFSSISQRGNALVHQVSTIVFQNTDVVLITLFLGLKFASVYSIYNLYYNVFMSVLTVIATAFVYKLGQSIFTDKAKFIKTYDCFETFFTAFLFAVYSTLIIFALPFVKLYTTGITDVSTGYSDELLAFLFLATNMLTAVRMPSIHVINCAGHFKKTQWRSIAETCINITVSIVCINFFGIYGALIGTVAALLYRTNDIIIYSNKRILGRSPLKCYIRIGSNLALFLILLFISRAFLTFNITNYGQLILYGGCYFICAAVLYFGLSVLINRNEWKTLINAKSDLKLIDFLKK